MFKFQRGISTLIGITIIIVVLILVIGGFFAYKKWGVPKIFNNKSTTNNEQQTTQDETAGWKIYKNAEYGFEIKYPGDTQCGQFIDNGNGDLNFGRIEIAVLDSGELNLSDFVDKYLSLNSEKFNTIDSKTPTKIDAGNAITVNYRSGGTNRFGEATFLKNNTNVYGIGFTAGSFNCDEPQIFSKMLSTFKFINSQDEIANWKIYTNKNWGIELKHPNFEGEYELYEEGPDEVSLGKIYNFMISIKKFKLQDSQTFRDVLVKNTTLGESPKHPDFNMFELRKIGDNYFYYIFPYLFEGQYIVSYWFVVDSVIFEFSLTSYVDTTELDPDSGWMDPKLDIEKQPSHIVFKKILSTFKFTK